MDGHFAELKLAFEKSEVSEKKEETSPNSQSVLAPTNE